MPDDPTRSGDNMPPFVRVGAQIGSYRIESYIDQGGMASVYAATDLNLNRRVALKVLARDLSDTKDFRERFVRESRFAASLDHPNIVPIYDAGEADGFLYIAMRYVRGGNLSVLLRDGPLDPARALAILGPVAHALDTAHAAGLVHRDVKPANILLSSTVDPEGFPHVYLTDFGLTKRTTTLTKLTATGHFIGTMAYISPEQIRGEKLDSLTDLYALACVAYECLTGVPPFVRDDQAALLWAHLADQPTAISHYRRDLAPADSVVSKALAKDPRDRYQTCDAFVQELSDVLLSGRHRTPRLAEDSGATAGESEPGLVNANSVNRTEPPGIGERTSQSHAAQPVDELRSAATGSVMEPTSSPDDVKPQGPPPVGPSDEPPVRPHRMSPAKLSAIAIIVVAAAILTVIVVGRLTSDTQSGPSLSSGAPDSESTSSTLPADDGTPPSSAATVAQAPSAPGPVAPVPSLAIPSIDGQPIPVGSTPGYVAITPNGLQAYVANRAAGVVTVVDTTVDQVSAKIPMPAGPPQYIAFSPDGAHAYVSIFDSDETTNLVAVLDTRTTRVQETIPVDKKPVALAVNPEQNFVYVPSHDAGAVDIIDTLTNKVTQSIAVSPNPHWVAFGPKGARAYIANHESNLVSVMDTATNKVVATIPVGTSPHSVAVSPDGSQVAVVCFDSNDVYFIDAATNVVTGTQQTGSNPQDVAYAPDGKYVYTANVDSNDVSVIDTQTRTVTARVPVPSPTSVAVQPDGRKAYVTNLDAGTLTVLKTGD